MKPSLLILMFLIAMTIAGRCMPRTSQQRSAKQESVVLLHGLTRSGKAMEKMANALRAEGYTVINHDYPSTSATIEKLTEQVFQSLEPLLKNAGTVHFATHSMGGITQGLNLIN